MRRAAAALSDIDGVLLLDKPAGPSSNQAMQRARRALAARKAGHAGTLDPLATGLLPVLLGEATKFAGSLADADKVYEATVLLGVTTSSGDLAGEIVARKPVDCSAERVNAVASRFVGDITQVPPMHSAIKINGQRLYELARRGETVPRAERRVRVTALTVLDVRDDECDIEVRCSKGTYVRVLAEDIGAALGCGATLKTLRRTMVGRFGIAAATALAELETRGARWALSRLLPIDAALDHLPALWLERREAQRVLHGQAIPVPAAADSTSVRIYDRTGQQFLGLGEVAAQTLYVRRLVATGADI